MSTWEPVYRQADLDANAGMWIDQTSGQICAPGMPVTTRKNLHGAEGGCGYCGGELLGHGIPVCLDEDRDEMPVLVEHLPPDGEICHECLEWIAKLEARRGAPPVSTIRFHTGDLVTRVESGEPYEVAGVRITGITKARIWWPEYVCYPYRVDPVTGQETRAVIRAQCEFVFDDDELQPRPRPSTRRPVTPAAERTDMRPVSVFLEEEPSVVLTAPPARAALEGPPARFAALLLGCSQPSVRKP